MLIKLSSYILEVNMKKWFSVFLIAMIALSLYAGGSSETASSSSDDPFAEPVELILYSSGSSGKDTEMVMDRFNEILSEKCNTTIDVTCLGWDNYLNQYQLILTTGEPADLMYVNPNIYSIYAPDGAFMDVTDMFPEYMPTVYSYFTQEQFDHFVKQIGFHDKHIEHMRRLAPVHLVDGRQVFWMQSGYDATQGVQIVLMRLTHSGLRQHIVGVGAHEVKFAFWRDNQVILAQEISYVRRIKQIGIPVIVLRLADEASVMSQSFYVRINVLPPPIKDRKLVV